MSEPSSSSASSISLGEVVRPPLQLVRLPIDKPQPAVAFLESRSRGVMDLIAHFWERLPQTPPLLRNDLHLVVASLTESDNVNINIPQMDAGAFTGAMLYVPKAHRADVLALDPSTAAAFASYISYQGPKVLKSDNSGMTAANAAVQESTENGGGKLPLTDLSISSKGAAGGGDPQEMPAEPPSGAAAKAAGGNGKIPIDFLTGDADTIFWMTPLLLPLVHKRTPARQLVNVVMQLPEEIPAEADPAVRLARGEDIPVLNRWRRLYKEERGIVFDADMDAWIAHQRVFVYEVEKQVVAVAKVDLELHRLVEIGGVYTFPEFRKHGFGGGIVRDIAVRIRQMGKTPTLQVDEQNLPALHLYEKAGWRPMGKLARVWLTG